MVDVKIKCQKFEKQISDEPLVHCLRKEAKRFIPPVSDWWFLTALRVVSIREKTISSCSKLFYGKSAKSCLVACLFSMLAVLFLAFLTPSTFAGYNTVTEIRTLEIGNLICIYNSTCGGSYVDFLHISNLTDAHAELPNQSNYTNRLCCKSPVANISTFCGDKYLVMFHLSNETNAHVELNNNSQYSINVCMELNSTSYVLNWSYRANCSGYGECLASVSNDTNAHIGDCDSEAAYSTRLCTDIILDTTAPSVSLVSPANGSNLTSGSTVTFAYRVSDANDIANCSLVLNGQLNMTDTTITKDTNQTFVQILANAQYNWSVNCTDAANNVGQSATWEFNMSYGVPYFVLNSPANASVDSASYQLLNVTVYSNTGDTMTVWFWGSNQSDFNGSNSLLYVAYDVANYSNLTYNWTSPVVVPGDNDLVLLLHFDNRSEFGENNSFVYDFSGNGNNGTVSGAVFNRSGGKFAGAFKFDGNNSYIWSEAYLAGGNPAPNFSISFWFKAESVKDGNYIVAMRDNLLEDAGDIRFYSVGLPPTIRVMAERKKSISWMNAVGTTTPQAGLWYHVAVTYDNAADAMKVYLNGVNDTSSVNSGSGVTSSWDNFSFGSKWNNSGTYFNGTIDEVAIWNRTLSADEILNHYRLDEGKYYWKVNATDNLDRGNESLVWEFTVDTTSPAISLNYPGSGAVLGSSVINFNWTVTDNLDTSVLCNLTVGGVVRASDVVSPNGTATNYSVSGLTSKTYLWNVTCWDDATNVNTSETRSFALDVTPPRINFTAPTPSNDTSTSNTHVDINVSITNASDLDEVKFDWNGTNYTFYDDLVLMFNFDNVSVLGENDSYAVDLSGQGNNGTVNNATFNATGGKYYGAFEFDGDGDYINVSDDDSLDLDTFFIEFWFKPDTTYDSGSGYVPLVYYDNYEVSINGGNMIFRYSNDNITSTTNNWSKESWYHIVAIYDGSVQELYVNGSLETSSKVYSLSIKNSSKETVSAFDNRGNLVLQSNLEQSSDYQRTADDLFVIRNNGEDVLIVAQNGSMYIDGTLFENQTTLTSSDADNDFRIKDESGNLIAFVNESGYLFLKGGLTENGSP
jgi:hypothetical protein